jgi:hypothetical protein
MRKGLNRNYEQNINGIQAIKISSKNHVSPIHYSPERLRKKSILSNKII